MNKEEFFSRYPIREKDSNKYDNGVVLFVSGSYGMAGAAALNLTGARSAGCSYIHSMLPASIYPIVAQKEMTAVYHVYSENCEHLCEDDAYMRKVKAIGFGSGLDHCKSAENYLGEILSCKDIPLVVDAHGLRLFAKNDTYYGKHSDMIFTPHMGEFSVLCGYDVETIMKNREEIALEFAKKRDLVLVLKGPETLVVSPDGRIYRNDSGNAALARAGSGDVLTGMISGLRSLYEDSYTAAKDAVWLHGYLCDQAMREHSMEVFDLFAYPILADRFFKER